jgi:hypothetical protein
VVVINRMRTVDKLPAANILLDTVLARAGKCTREALVFPLHQRLPQ